MTMTQERMNTVGNDETFSDDIRALRKERAKIKNRRDDIVIFPNGDKWFVFDDDANRLFEVLGWQTSEKLMDEGAISWMSLSDEGREALLLTDLEPISLWKHAEINVAGWSSEEDYKADRLSLAQQTLDYLLWFNRNDHAIVNLGKFPIYSKDGDIDTTENICFVDFDGRGCVNLFTESGKTINLVYGQEWNMMGDGDYIISTGNMLNAQLEDVKHMLVNYGSVEMQRQLKTDDVMDEYNSVLSKYRYDHVLMEQQDFYEALGDDAVSMASKYHLKLWDRDAGNGLVVPMVMLNINQVDKVLSEADDVLIEESRIMESRDELALKPSPLNEGLNETLHFNESGIKKTRNGDYMVWARLNGVDLPDKEITPEMGIRYLRLTGGAEKEVLLRSALQQSYGTEISQLASRSQSAMVKI